MRKKLDIELIQSLDTDGTSRLELPPASSHRR